MTDTTNSNEAPYAKLQSQVREVLQNEEINLLFLSYKNCGNHDGYPNYHWMVDVLENWQIKIPKIPKSRYPKMIDVQRAISQLQNINLDFIQAVIRYLKIRCGDEYYMQAPALFPVRLLAKSISEYYKSTYSNRLIIQWIEVCHPEAYEVITCDSNWMNKLYLHVNLVHTALEAFFINKLNLLNVNFNNSDKFLELYKKIIKKLATPPSNFEQNPKQIDALKTLKTLNKLRNKHSLAHAQRVKKPVPQELDINLLIEVTAIVQQLDQTVNNFLATQHT